MQIIQSPPGSGKTISYLLPLLALAERAVRSRHPQFVVLVPTRELAVQVAEVARQLFRQTQISALALVGGTSPQVLQR
jgi:superfamily II DNA/RNA helicase